jgi:putative membrane protein
VHAFLATLIAQADSEISSGSSALGYHLAAAFIFSVFGVLTLALCVWIMGRLSPFSLVKEIEEDHNTAAAIVMGAVLLGMSIIIAAAIVG